MSLRLIIRTVSTLAAGVFLMAGTARAEDPAACDTVRMSNPGWTDISSTNAMAGIVLKALGYTQKVDTISVPITFQALKNAQIDVFLGNWMPAQTHFVAPLEQAGDIEVARANLSGAKFTLAVPDYVAQAGVHSFADLAAHAAQFDHKIYGIEPGAPANQNIQKMLDAHDFGLTGWTLSESGEQGMLSQVERAERKKAWIVFLAWEPHPMNTKYHLTYLSGGDKYFGPDYGSATVNTLARQGYLAACPNLARLFRQMAFSIDAENGIMAAITDGTDADKAAADYLRRNPAVIASWLQGVTTATGGDGAAAVYTALRAS